MQPVDLQVGGGGDSWHPRQLFALSWSNPPGVTTAVHYRLLDPGGAVLIGDTTLPWTASAIDHLSVPGTPGAYTAEVWLEDGGGARAHRSSAKLRFDDARPGAVEPVPFTGWIGRSGFPFTRPPRPPRRPRRRSPASAAMPSRPIPRRAGRPCAGADLQRRRDRPAERNRRRRAADRRASRGPELRARGRRLGFRRPFGGCRHHDPARRQDRAS